MKKTPKADLPKRTPDGKFAAAKSAAAKKLHPNSGGQRGDMHPYSGGKRA